MKTYTKILTIAVAAVTSGVLFTTSVYGDDDDYDEGFGWFRQSRLDVAPVSEPLYREECGSCHFAYQPGLLPEQSWRKLMAGLDDHFGDNAELDSQTHKRLLDYLVANSADKSDFKRSKRIADSIRGGDTPLRISDTLYFKRKHDEINSRYVTENKDVGSFSNCSACHTRADTGSFNEHEVKIPGLGYWED